MSWIAYVLFRGKRRLSRRSECTFSVKVAILLVWTGLLLMFSLKSAFLKTNWMFSFEVGHGESAGKDTHNVERQADILIDEQRIITDAITTPRERNNQRVGQVHKKCQELLKRGHTPRQKGWLLVDDDLQSIYCAISKAGSTSWKYALIRHHLPEFKAPASNRAVHVHSPSNMRRAGLRYMNTYNKTEQQKLVQKYTKYIITRHPLARLVSAYKDKMLQPDEVCYRTEVAGVIKERFRGTNDPDVDVTFQEFVRYLLSENPEQLDRHWIPMMYACQPCYYSYQYVARVESLAEDAPVLLQKLGVPVDGFQLQFLNTHSKGGYDMSFMEAFRNITVLEYRDLMELYKDDMQMFGYEIPPYPTGE